MRKIIGVAVISGVLVVSVIALVPAHIELTVGPAEGGGAAVSGWISSADQARVSLDQQRTPWEARFGAEDLMGFVEADGDGRVRVRARMFKGPLPVSELRLEGTQLSFMKGPEGLSGRAR